MDTDDFPVHSDAVTDAQRVRTALVSTLEYIQRAQPSTYALAQHLVTTALFLAQECKGPYLNGVAHVFRDEIAGEDWKEWVSFKNKLIAQTLKAQAIVQGVAQLLEDWPVRNTDVPQLGLFRQATPRDIPDLSI